MKIQATISKITSKALLVEFSTNNGIYQNKWLPLSKISFSESIDQLKDELIEHGCAFTPINIPMWLFNKMEITTYNPNNNSIWCEIFKKQDQNGFTENGYAL